jgi:hypothetical protein
MLYGEPQLYAGAREAKLGRSSLSGPLDELRDWVNARYSINVLDVVYDSIKLGPHKSRPRLNLIIETTRDFEQLHKDIFTLKPNIKSSILNRFSRIVSASSESAQFNTNDVHLITDDFSREAMGQAAEQFLRNDGQAVLTKFPDAHIWDISGHSTHIVVFYLKEDDIARNQNNGSSDAIRQECYDGVKLYDEFDYFTPDNFSIKFDSKQNVDENYEGSMFYYWR